MNTSYYRKCITVQWVISFVAKFDFLNLDSIPTSNQLDNVTYFQTFHTRQAAVRQAVNSYFIAEYVQYTLGNDDGTSYNTYSQQYVWYAPQFYIQLKTRILVWVAVGSNENGFNFSSK